MDILQQIGVNSTAFIQFGLFIFAILFLSKVVFGPFTEALYQRKHNTKGGEELALEIQKKTQELTTQYEAKARALNEEIKTIINNARTSASKDFENTVNKSRVEANAIILDNRTKIDNTMKSVMTEIRAQASQISMLIVNKLLGK